MKLSDRNNKIQTTARPQSPQVAGMQVTLPPGSQIPSGWVELNGQTLTGAQNAYPDLWAASPAAWKSGSDLVLPDGPRRSQTVANLSFSSTPSGWSLVNSYGIAEQDASGQWWLSFAINAGTNNGTNRSTTIDGIQWDQDFIGIGSYLGTVAGSAQAGSSGSVQLISASNNNDYRVSGKIPLASKPTDAFVGADARFSTFDEALEGIPCIKLYSDTASAVSVGINEATTTEAGVVKANKVQTKGLAGLSAASLIGQSFSGLTVGKMYRLNFAINIFNTSTTARVELSCKVMGTTTPLRLRVADQQQSADESSMTISCIFIADSTTLVINDATGFQQTTTNVGASFWQIEELNNTVETTDFT